MPQLTIIGYFYLSMCCTAIAAPGRVVQHALEVVSVYQVASKCRHLPEDWPHACLRTLQAKLCCKLPSAVLPQPTAGPCSSAQGQTLVLPKPARTWPIHLQLPQMPSNKQQQLNPLQVMPRQRPQPLDCFRGFRLRQALAPGNLLRRLLQDLSRHRLASLNLVTAGLAESCGNL
jgi:hypothetical protein